MSLNDLRAMTAKIESSYGTDPTPTGASNAMLVYDVVLTPIAGSTVERPIKYPTFGAIPRVHVNKHVAISFKIPMAGSGAAGTAPAYGPILRACGMSETITASTKVEYKPVSSGWESCTIYDYEDGPNHKLIGFRGTATFMFPANELPYIQIEGAGIWTAPAAAAFPSLTLSAWIDPLPVNKVNTPTYTIDSFAAILHNLSCALNNRYVHRDRPNAAQVVITGRPAVTGEIEFDAPALGTKDFFAIAVANTQMVQQLIHGITAGNICQLDNPKAQLLQPAYGDADGVKTLRGTLQYNRNAGDDEFVFTAK